MCVCVMCVCMYVYIIIFIDINALKLLPLKYYGIVSLYLCQCLLAQV